MKSGATCDEAERALGKIHQSLSARFTELKQVRPRLVREMFDENGHVVRRPTRAGRPAEAWGTTRRGQAYALANRPIFRDGSLGDPTRSYHRGNSASDDAFALGDPNQRANARLELLKYINDQTPHDRPAPKPKTPKQADLFAGSKADV